MNEIRNVIMEITRSCTTHGIFSDDFMSVASVTTIRRGIEKNEAAR